MCRWFIIGVVIMALAGFSWSQTPESQPGWSIFRQSVSLPPLPSKITKAFVIPIREQITSKLAHAVRRKVIRCKAQGAQMVIFDMDTFGGELVATEKICTLISDELKDIYTIVFIDHRALSAGSIIALSADEIVMDPQARMGAAKAVMGTGQDIPKAMDMKVESSNLAMVRAMAKKGGYNELVAEAMLMPDTELWIVRNKATQEMKIVSADEYEGKVIGSPSSSDDVNPIWDAPWEYVKTIVKKGKLLTMTAAEAKQLGFVKVIVPDMKGLEKHYNISSPPVVLEDNWSEDLVEFLTHPVVAGILFFLMLMFGYIEMHTPGFGLFGGVAIACLLLLFCSQFLVGLAQWWEIGLVALGLILLALEIFVIPGFGVAGVAGILLIIAGLLAMAIPNAPGQFPWPDSTMDWSIAKSLVLAMALGFIGFFIAAAILSQFLPKMTVLSRTGLMLVERTPAVDASVPEESSIRQVDVGEEGVAASVLRPSGQVRFGDDLIDCVTDGQMVYAGTPVRVSQRRGNRVVVEAIEEKA